MKSSSIRSDFRRTCRTCGTTYEPEDVPYAFKEGGHRRCICCMRTAADARKATDRFPQKAYDSARAHAARFGITLERLIDYYGWRLDRLTRDLRIAWDGLCPDCEKPYREMGHGLADLSFDIINPHAEPFYLTNVRIICLTNNREKGKLGPEAYEGRLRVWRRWRANKNKIVRLTFGWE